MASEDADVACHELVGTGIWDKDSSWIRLPRLCHSTLVTPIQSTDNFSVSSRHPPNLPTATSSSGVVLSSREATGCIMVGIEL